MTQRTIDAGTSSIDLEPVPGQLVVEGHPLVGGTELGTIAGAEVGIWTHTVGTSTDVEVDELSVIVSGAATVVINETETVELRPGTVLRLNAGDRTVWTITEALRKVYVVSA